MTSDCVSVSRSSLDVGREHEPGYRCAVREPVTYSDPHVVGDPPPSPPQRGQVTPASSLRRQSRAWHPSHSEEPTS